jgi:transcriptional antiterminator RfaH
MLGFQGSRWGVIQNFGTASPHFPQQLVHFFQRPFVVLFQGQLPGALESFLGRRAVSQSQLALASEDLRGHPARLALEREFELRFGGRELAEVEIGLPQAEARQFVLRILLEQLLVTPHRIVHRPRVKSSGLFATTQKHYSCVRFSFAFPPLPLRSKLRDVTQTNIAAARSLTSYVPSGCAWFCLRTQQKHEHLAAGRLRLMEQVEVFLPRIHFARPWRGRKVWVTEPLFPGYLFARFNWHDSLPRVRYAPGVQNVVHFGNRWPTIPDHVIQELTKTFGADELHVISEEIKPGDQVQIIGELFHGLRAVVTQVMPGRQRVNVLIEFLGRQTMVEISADAVIKSRA